MHKVMGIDYGSHRVGIAVSDDYGRYAFPKTILTNDDTLLDAIVALAEREGVRLFVVGEADNPAGGENAIVRRIRIFSQALAVQSELPVETVSEAYSSAEARRALEEKVRTRKDTTVDVDAAAAAIILQTYLDIHPHTTH